jgi:predicted transposase YbfD/YdcC
VDLADWPKCKTIGCIDSLRRIGNRESALEQALLHSSRALSTGALAEAVRAHWGIENRLNWVLDVSFGEDASPLRKDNAPQNLSRLCKIALRIVREDSTQNAQVSLQLRRKGALVNGEARMHTLGSRTDDGRVRKP